MSIRSTGISTAERARLSRATRALASAERNDFHRGGPLVLGAISERLDLLARITALLDDRQRDVDPAAISELARLVTETPPVRDYGAAARQRNARIAAILARLEGGA